MFLLDAADCTTVTLLSPQFIIEIAIIKVTIIVEPMSDEWDS